jgi:hypothetical protein
VPRSTPHDFDSGRVYRYKGKGAVGGGTPWITASSLVVPGEVMTLELMIVDVGDTSYDSHALLDNFRWNP